VDKDAAQAEALLARWGIKRGMSDKESEMNVLWTSLLDGGCLLLLALLLSIGAFAVSTNGLSCSRDLDCDPGRIVIAFVVLVGGTVAAFVLTVGVSVVLLVRRRPASAVPVAGGFAMCICFAAAMLISGGT
jgi:hypothetical protein